MLIDICLECSSWAAVVPEIRSLELAKAKRINGSKSSGNIECYFVCRRFKWAKNEAHFLFSMNGEGPAQTNQMKWIFFFFFSSFIGFVHVHQIEVRKFLHWTFHFHHLEMISCVLKHFFFSKRNFQTSLDIEIIFIHIKCKYFQTFYNTMNENICYMWKTW